MDCAFHLQDPTSPDTVYLFEAIIEAAHAAAIRGSWPECPLVTAVDALAEAHD